MNINNIGAANGITDLDKWEYSCHLSFSIEIQAAHSVVFAVERNGDEGLNLSPSWRGSHCYLIPNTGQTRHSQ